MERILNLKKLTLLLLLMVGAGGIRAQEFLDITAEVRTVDPTATDVQPIGINDDGWIVGHYSVVAGNQLFVWIPGSLQEDGSRSAATIRLVRSGQGLTAAGISNNGTIIYNVTAGDGTVTGYYHPVDPSTGDYLNGDALGTESLQMKAISENWIAADAQLSEETITAGFSIGGLTFTFSTTCPFGQFPSENYVRAMVFEIGAGGPLSGVQLAFPNAELCNLSSRAYAIKADPVTGKLLYVGGESFGEGQGDEKFTRARAMAFAQEVGDNFLVTEQIGGTPGVIRAINSLGGTAGSWFTKSTDRSPNAQRGFYSAVGCVDFSGQSLPYSDILPDRDVLAQGINDDNIVVGNFLYTATGEGSVLDRTTNRAFLYQSGSCTDRTAPPLTETGSVDLENTNLTFKDMTNFALRHVAGQMSGWEVLNTAKAVNINNQVIGRGTLDSGEQHAYLFSFEECDLLPVRGLNTKGDFGFLDPDNMDIHEGINERLEKIYFEQEDEFIGLSKTFSSLDFLFNDVDALEGPGNSQGWFVNEVAEYGPAESATLLTNKTQFYPNGVKYEITSNPFIVPENLGYEWQEAILGFKVWSNQERGIYDYVQIEVKSVDQDNWSTPIFISESLDPTALYSNLIDLETGDIDAGWAQMFVDLSPWKSNSEAVQMRFTFESDDCEFGEGVMFKDFRIYGISEEIQHAEFLSFMSSGGVNIEVASVEAAVAALVAAAPTGTAGGIGAGLLKGISVAVPPIGIGIGIGVALGLAIDYTYDEVINPAQEAHAIMFSAPQATLDANPTLSEFLDHKKQVFFDGFWSIGQYDRQGTDAVLAYGKIIDAFESIKEEATSATRLNPAHLTSFSNAQSKELSLVFPTETHTILHQNNTRLWLKKVFAELALYTESIDLRVYVYNTFKSEYIEITTPEDIGANTDYLYAYELAQTAMDVATEVWDDERQAYPYPEPPVTTAPSPELGIPTTVDESGAIVLDQSCKITDGVEKSGGRTPQRKPQPRGRPLPAPLPILQKSETSPCGRFTVWLGGAGIKTRTTLEKHKTISTCYSMVSNRANNGSSALGQSLNTLTTEIIPYGGAVRWDVNANSSAALDLFVNPEDGHYYDGSEISLEVKEGFTLERAWYEKTIYANQLNRKEVMERMGLKNVRKQIPLRDQSVIKIDHIDFEKDDLISSALALGDESQFYQIPANGNFTIRACARNQSQEYVDQEIRINLLPNRLSSVGPTGRQRVVFDLNTLDVSQNAVIVVPGAAAIRGSMHTAFTEDGLDFKERRYDLEEDLIYEVDGLVNDGRYQFFDRWDGFNTYVWNTPAYMEPNVFGISSYKEIADRILKNPGPDGIEWFDDNFRGVRDNASPQVPNDISPTLPLWKNDQPYLQQILARFSAAALSDANAEVKKIACPLPGSENHDRVLNFLVHDVSVLRIIPTITEILKSNDYSNLRIRIGLLNPVWPESTNSLGNVTGWLRSYIDDLSKMPNVTVFTANSQKSLREQVYGDRGEGLLSGTIQYDLSILQESVEGEITTDELNPKALLNYFYALGSSGDLEISHCREAVADPLTEFLGFSQGLSCYRTFRKEIGLTPLVAYTGPKCSLRGYFKDSETNQPISNYSFDMLNLNAEPSADHQIEGIYNRSERYKSFPLLIKDISTIDKELLNKRVTGEEQPTTNE